MSDCPKGGEHATRPTYDPIAKRVRPRCLLCGAWDPDEEDA